MSQVLKNLQFATQSFIGTPDTGTGVIFASGSKIYFENATGSIFPLGGPGYLIVREYTGSNAGGGTLTYTWSTPVNIKHIQVICVGAGGGGGSGAFLTSGTGTRATGGAGGGGGAIAWGFFDRQNLTQPSYTISVGGGGVGGGSRTHTAANQNGIAGSVGQYTTFGGTMVSASGGNGGGAGGLAGLTIVGGVGGLNTNCLPGPGFAIRGGTGANTPGGGLNATNAANFFTTPTIPVGTAGGGAGPNLSLGGVFGSGSLGAGAFEWNTLNANNSASGNSGSNDLVSSITLLHFTSSIYSTLVGLGGGGNGVLTPGDTTTAGGRGGFYGAGGGGSGFARGLAQSPTSPGGSGSSGLCIVVEYY
jgi:hypothetical protein